MFALLPLLGFLGFSLGAAVITLGICGFWIGVGRMLLPKLTHGYRQLISDNSLRPILNASFHRNHRDGSLAMRMREFLMCQVVYATGFRSANRSKATCNQRPG